MAILQVNKDIKDKVSWGLPSVISAVPPSNRTNIKDAASEIKGSYKRDNSGPGVTYVTGINTGY